MIVAHRKLSWLKHRCLQCFPYTVQAWEINWLHTPLIINPTLGAGTHSSRPPRARPLHKRGGFQARPARAGRRSSCQQARSSLNSDFDSVSTNKLLQMKAKVSYSHFKGLRPCSDDIKQLEFATANNYPRLGNCVEIRRGISLRRGISPLHPSRVKWGAPYEKWSKVFWRQTILNTKWCKLIYPAGHPVRVSTAIHHSASKVGFFQDFTCSYLYARGTGKNKGLRTKQVGLHTLFNFCFKFLVLLK